VIPIVFVVVWAFGVSSPLRVDSTPQAFETPGPAGLATTVAGVGSRGGDGPFSLWLGVEARRDRLRYHFDNPSRYDTADLVPHYFEQRYVTDNAWVAMRARYRAGGRWWQTEGGVAAWATGSGEDYDTFFNPDGNVIVYGTTAPTGLLSWRVAQFVELGPVAGFRTRVGYVYHRDRSVFRPSNTVVTTTSPPARTEFWNANRETTISELHEVRFGAARVMKITNRWLLDIVADLAPTALARLTTLLPDKYPNQPIVFTARAATLETGLRAQYRRGSTFVTFTIGYAGAWSYSPDRVFGRDSVSLALEAGFSR
jgi:hypothetical protein